MKKQIIVLILFTIIFSSHLISAIDNDLNLNIQTRDSSGNIISGTFDFTFEFSTSENCGSAVYTHSQELTTDSRGVINYYLPDADLDYTDQYYFCYYRDGVLKNNQKLVGVPYAFNSKTLGGYSENFFAPLNKTFFGNFEFNGGYSSGGLSIIDGNLFAQTLFAVNLTSLGISNLNVNGSLIPQAFDNTFDLGNQNLKWRDLFIGRNADVSGNLVVEGTITGDGAVPSGAVMHFDLSSCPSGWSELTSARGRYLIGLNSGGTLGATVGTALSNSENRAVGQHTHNFGIRNEENSGGDLPEQSGPGAASGITTTGASGTVAGTNAPYIQLLVCRKN